MDQKLTLQDLSLSVEKETQTECIEDEGLVEKEIENRELTIQVEQ